VPTPKQIGRTLTRHRKAQSLSQKGLAERAGISRAYIAKLEAGISDPTVGMVTRLAKALGVTMEDLLR
jgi:transcriptional regulator with XRE-family HTH domain